MSREPDELDYKILELINKLRAHEGLPPSDELPLFLDAGPPSTDEDDEFAYFYPGQGEHPDYPDEYIFERVREAAKDPSKHEALQELFLLALEAFVEEKEAEAEVRRAQHPEGFELNGGDPVD